MADPGHHLHQQGGRRDAHAGWPNWSGPGPSACGCRPSTRPACGSCGPTATAWATRARSPSTTTPTPAAWSRSSPASSTSTPRSCRRGRSSARSARPSPASTGPSRVPGRRRHHLRPPDRRRLRPLPAAHAGGQRHGLRRPAAQRGPAVRRAPRRARALPDPLHPRPDRRVPGHQRRAERAGRPAGRRPPQHRGGGGQRPVGLPVPGRGHLQHPRLRAGVPRRHRHHPRPELPLDPDHPRRRQRGDRQQRVPQAQVAVDRPGDGRADRPLPGRGRARRGRVGGPRDRPAPQRPGPPVGRRRRLLPDQRPEPAPSRRPWSAAEVPYKVVGGTKFYDRTRGQGRPGLPAGAGQPRRRGQLAADRQRAQAGRGGHVGGQAVRVGRPPRDLLRRGGGRTPTRPASAARPAGRWRTWPPCSTDLRAPDGRARSGRRER